MAERSAPIGAISSLRAIPCFRFTEIEGEPLHSMIYSSCLQRFPPSLSFPHSSRIMLNCISPLPYVFSISPGSGSWFRACVLISVNDGTFHPTQCGVDLLDAEERAYPEREARKRDQFAWSEFLDQFKFWLKLLDVLGIIKAPFVGRPRAPAVRARSFHN